MSRICVLSNARARFRKECFLALSISAAALSSSVAIAQDVDARIRALQEQLEAVKASIREEQEMIVDIEGELADLTQQVSGGTAVQSGHSPY